MLEKLCGGGWVVGGLYDFSVSQSPSPFLLSSTLDFGLGLLLDNWM